MGQFASSISLTWEDILTLTEEAITDESVATADLDMISLSLNPRVSVTVTEPVLTNLPQLSLTIAAALTAANKESEFIYRVTFPAVTLPNENLDFGVVLNYHPAADDFKTLTDQLMAFLSAHKFPVSLAASIAAKLQPQVMASAGTPSVTYGREATKHVHMADPLITIDYLFWVAAFGIFQTSAATDNGTKSYAVIYSFRAAIGSLTGTMQ